jgi:hypothetical protein
MTKAQAMMQRIWSHQRDDPRGALRVYITGGDPSHEAVLRKLMRQALVTDCWIDLLRDTVPGVRLTESGIAAVQSSAA